jgi:GH24 family phage-related lysozyme (muramidase)
MAVTLADLSSALLMVLEGCRLRAYLDTGGVPTVGIGHIVGVKMGDAITLEQARAFFVQDQAALLAALQDKPLLEGAALVSFGFNCGPFALERVLSGEAQLTDFIRDHLGNVVPALQARRNLEATLIAASKS